ncbi:polysaccharide biosynthesis C-terminal domain-containing protein [Aquabacterium sp. A7-Y]|uniref:lipopolysaccharide biosynthesis protein n=1 Tax=Aquabacterium sp. A7-Y TaxID=1349605 RepID=UPI00223DB395|nr:polysaccharide biosynthesis C-terminal domain-containing protein [Aquabacterium sp. A7-Y]MCW7541783.1 polysaccharide biosynthesis C-terminal domain-containing protein [Aquabacterium sp. A7-Y]
MSTSPLSRGALAHFAAKLVSVALGLAIVVVVARQGPEQQGQFSLLIATEAVFAALFSGLGLVIARQVSHHRQAAGAWLGGALVLALAGGLAGAAVFTLAAQALGGDPAYRFLPLLAVAAPLLLFTPTLSGLYLGEGRMGPINALSIAPPLLTLLGLAALWLGGVQAGLMQVVAVWLAARAGVGVAGALLAARGAGLQAPVWSAWRAQAHFCTVVGLTNLVSWLNYRVDLFIVERYAGLGAAGVYSVAVTAAELLWFVSSSVSAAAYARIGVPDARQAAALTVRVVHLNLAMLLLVTPLLLLAAWWLLPRLLGAPYTAVLPLLALLLPGVWAYASASTLSAFYTNFLGRPQLSAAVATVSLAVNVGVCSLLVPHLGAAGGALATSASYLLAIAWGLALFRRHAGLSWGEVLRPQGRQLLDDLRAPLRRAGR